MEMSEKASNIRISYLHYVQNKLLKNKQINPLTSIQIIYSKRI